MISAGYIGGGVGEGPVAPASAPVPTASVGSPGSSISMPMSSIPAGDVTAKDFLNVAQSGINQNYWGMAANFFTGLVNNIFGFAMQGQWLDAQEHINDRRADAAEHIATDEYQWRGRALDAAQTSDERMNGPNGLKERLAKIEAQKDEGMYKDHLASQERLAALQNLDRAFSLGRNDYSYGNPFAAG